MRPDRFLALLTTAAQSAPGVTRAEPVTEDGRSKRPFLLAVEAGGRTTRWQVTAASAPGDDYSKPEPDERVLGARPEAPAVTPAAVGSPEHIEGALIAAVLAADAGEEDQGEIAAVERYSTREQPPAVGHGATFLCHSGARIFVNRVR